MKKLFKKILVGLGIFIMLLVIVAVVLPLVADPNDYKEEIRDAVRAQTNRDLTVGGEIKWTVFPWLGLSISDVTLSNRAGFGDRPMLSIGEASAAVKLMPLFSQKVELGKITLNDLTVNLSRKANGQANWEDLGESQSTAVASSAGTTGGGDASGFDNLVVSEIEVNNANIRWDDTGEITELRGFGLTVSNLEPGRPFDLKGGFSVNLAESQLVGDVKFSGQIKFAADGTRYGVDEFDLSFNGAQGNDTQSMALDLAIKAHAEIDLAADTAKLEGFSLQFHQLLTTGDLTVTSLSTEPKLAGKLKLAEFNPRVLLAAMGLPAPLTASDDALTSLQAELSFTGSPNEISVQGLAVKFDLSALDGRLKVQNFEQPRLTFNFQLDELNLDDYLVDSEPVESDDLTVDSFRGFTGGGDFGIGRLIVAGLVATEVKLKMSSNGNGIRLFPIEAQFYSGRYQGDIKIDAGGKRPLLTTSQALSDINAKDLLQDLTGDAKLEGSGDFRLNVSTDLSNDHSMRQALDGDLSLNFNDGAIVGFNIAESIRTAKATLGLGPDATETVEQDPKTDFSELSMSGVFQQGVLTSNDLMLLSPLLRVTGKGQVNLVDETIDYLVKPTIVGSLEGQGAQDLDNLSGVPIPVKLTGNLYEPDIGIDIMAAITATQKARINEEKDKLFNKLLGQESDEDSGGNADNTEQTAATDSDSSKKNDDSVEALFKGFLGSKKSKKKSQDDPDDGGGQ